MSQFIQSLVNRRYIDVASVHNVRVVSAELVIQIDRLVSNGFSNGFFFVVFFSFF